MAETKLVTSQFYFLNAFVRSSMTRGITHITCFLNGYMCAYWLMVSDCSCVVIVSLWGTGQRWAYVNSIINYPIRTQNTMDTLDIKQDSRKGLCFVFCFVLVLIFCMTVPLVKHTHTLAYGGYRMGRSLQLKCFVVADSCITIKHSPFCSMSCWGLQAMFKKHTHSTQCLIYLSR